MLTSLYAHFPFCETKCHYCDFFSLPEAKIGRAERARVYEAISRELASQASRLAPLETVFLGGGTPSLVPLDVMASFVGGLSLAPGAEVTIEANPSSITREKARAWRDAGINRVSMGVQALDDARLEWLGRVHSKGAAFAALTALFEAGFENVSIDYIVGVPGQSTATIESELSDALARFPHIRHLSAYLLTLQKANPRCKQLPEEEEQLAHLRAVSKALGSQGFEQYEISNFARAGARARHNENYWLGGGYLGVGPSAHSFFDDTGTRAKNWASLGRYCELVEAGAPAAEWTEAVDAEQKRIEFLMLRLRRSAGVSLAEYRDRFGRDLLKDRGSWIDAWQKKALCVVDERLRLTADGFFLSDQILKHIV